MSTVRVPFGGFAHKNGQITIPKVICDQAQISPEDLLDVNLEGDGVIILEIKRDTSEEDESWFWSEEWQENERLADGDLKAGRVSSTFETADDAIKALKDNRL